MPTRQAQLEGLRICTQKKKKKKALRVARLASLFLTLHSPMCESTYVALTRVVQSECAPEELLVCFVQLWLLLPCFDKAGEQRRKTSVGRDQTCSTLSATELYLQSLSRIYSP